MQLLSAWLKEKWVTPATRNLACVLRDRYALSAKDLRLATQATHEVVASWLDDPFNAIEVEYYERLSVLAVALLYLHECSDKFAVAWLRAPHEWLDGSSLTTRRAIGEGKREEVLAHAHIAAINYKASHRRKRHAKDPTRKV